MQVISIISTKGGVGKTTTAANLGGLVADAGLRVLLPSRRQIRRGMASYRAAPGAIGLWHVLSLTSAAIRRP